MKKEVFNLKSSINVYNVDVNRIARPAGLLREMQECGSKQMAAEKPSYDELLDEGKALMLSRLDMVIHEDVHLNDEIQVYTWPCPSARATFLRNYQIKREGRIAAEISSQWSLVNIQTRKIMKVEDIDLSNYTHDEYKEVLTSSKLKISKEDAQAMDAVGEKTVMLSDVDYNGHMNNTYSLDMICDYIPELAEGTHKVTTIRIHFSNEAPLGERIVIKRLRISDDRYLFQTFRSDGQVNVEAEIAIEKR